MDRNLQYELFPAEEPKPKSELQAFLASGVSRRVELVLTRNRVSMVSIQAPVFGAIKVRLHEQFLSAPPSVLDALRRYLKRRRCDAWRVVTAYADTIEADPRRAAKTTGNARGEHYDLAEIMSEVNKEFFAGKVRCNIRWGRARPRKRRRRRSRSIRFGSWSKASRTVRIHPLLDDSRVPREFIRYIVFHEMLHAVVPSDRNPSRRRDHTPQFNALERAYPDIEKMHAMARSLIDVIL